MSDAGLFRMVVPQSLGGSELSPIALSRVCEVVAMGDASTGWCTSQNSGICRMSGHLPREGAEEIFGDPKSILAWGNGPARALKVPGGYRLTGRYSFASGIHHATWTGSHDAQVIGEDGEPLLEEDGATNRVRTLFFPVSDISLTDTWYVSGLAGTGSDSYTVTDLFVPEHRVTMPHAVEPGPLYLYGTTNIFSAGFASVSLGVARATLDDFLAFASTKTPRGISGPLREQQPTQIHIARAEAMLRSSRALLHQTLEEGWQATVKARELSLESRVSMRLATTYAINQAAEVVDVCYRNAGASAIFVSNGFERRFRDIHAATQHLQAREDHYEPIGQYLMGLEPSRAWL